MKNKQRKLIGFLFVGLALIISVNNASAWLDEDYLCRKTITLTGNTSGAQTDYQILLNVTYDSDMQTDFDDLRFANDTHFIDAWLESKVDSSYALVWVEFSTTPANTIEQDYYMYYGNTTVASDWDEAATFLAYDDFEDGDVSDWNLDAGVTFVASTTQVKTGTYSGQHTSTGDNQFAWKSLSSQYKGDVMIEADWWCNYTSDRQNRFFVNEGSTNLVSVVAKATNIDIMLNGADVGEFSASAWYKMELLIQDLATDTATLWWDTNELGTQDNHANMVDGIDKIGIGQYFEAETYQYIDNIRVRKYASNPATYGFGDKEAYFPYIPPTPTNLQNTSGNYWVNYTWSAGSGNVTDSYNVLFNRTWHNETVNAYWNQSLSECVWGNITIYGYNNSLTVSHNNISDTLKMYCPTIGQIIVYNNQHRWYTLIPFMMVAIILIFIRRQKT